MSSQWYFFCLLHQTRFFSVSFSLVHFYRRRREKIISGIIAHFARSTCLHQPVWERSPNSLYKEQKDKIPQVYFILEPRSREGWQRPLHVTLLLRLIKPVTVGSSFRIIFFSSFSFFLFFYFFFYFCASNHQGEKMKKKSGEKEEKEPGSGHIAAQRATVQVI